MRNRFTGPFLIHDVLNSTVLAESCCTGKLGYLHKSFLRNIPEKDMNKYETILGLSKLKLGSGHTNAECQDLLHQNRLLEVLDRQHKEGLAYGEESLPKLTADESAVTIENPDIPIPPDEERSSSDDEGDVPDDPFTTEPPSDVEEQPSTSRTVTFEEPRRSSRERSAPGYLKDFV